jgi:hypothetical protein
MRYRPSRAWLAALAVAAAPALAQESVLDRPPDPEAWPTELTRRPITLAAGMLELTIPADVNASQNRFAKPVSLAPSLYYGVSSALAVGVRHALGLCLSAADDGCRKAYDDVTLDTIWAFRRDVGIGVAVTASPVSDPSFALSAEARLIARWARGPVALAVAPTVSVGLSERDTPGVVKTLPITFPLASYGFGFYTQTSGNKEYLIVPVSLTAQAVPDVAISIGSAVHGPLYTADAVTAGGTQTFGGDFGDAYQIPLGAAVVVVPDRHVDLGASFTFLNLLGKHATSDAKALQVFASLRI